jgi:hypothetical protein
MRRKTGLGKRQKEFIMKTKLQYFCILLALLAGIHQAAAQGTTAFTYQGQLKDNGTNANGTYTMIFGLYNTSSGGFPVGSFITTSPTLVNGLFSVNLDFGNVFTNGSARWLDITITNSTAIQTLSPRVQVLPTPYALYAASANSAASVVSGINITNAIVTNSVLANDVITNSTFAGNGNGITNIPASAIVGLTNFINNTGTYKAAVQEATTTGLPNYTYSPGIISGINTGILTIDGIAVQQNDSVLVKNQGGANNGIYVCTTAGSQGASYVLTLRSDFNSAANIAAGDTVSVLQGVVNANTTWVLTNAGPITVGTTPLTFAQNSGGVKTLNGLTGNLSLVAGTNVSLFTNGNSLIIAASVPNIQLFGSSGTFVVPTNVTRIEVEMWGAGGGGGAAYYGPASGGTGNSNGGNDNGFSGGGGGAGAYAWNVFTVTNGTSFSVTAGTAGSAGNAGTGSSFGTLLSASGGSAGGNASSGGSGNGGSGGQTTPGSLVYVPGNAGQSGDTTGGGIGGDGGIVWRGGPGGRGSFYGNGSDASGGPGAGGGGAGPSSSSINSAGNGSLGVVIVHY